MADASSADSSHPFLLRKEDDQPSFLGGKVRPQFFNLCSEKVKNSPLVQVNLCENESLKEECRKEKPGGCVPTGRQTAGCSLSHLTPNLR